MNGKASAGCFLLLACLTSIVGLHLEKTLMMQYFNYGWIPQEMAMESLNVSFAQVVKAYDPCSPGVPVRDLFKALQSEQELMMISGGGCSSTDLVVASAAQYWNVFQMSFAATSPQLSKTQSYPFYGRVTPSEAGGNPFRLAIMRHFGWTRAAIVFQNLEPYSTNAKTLYDMFVLNNVTIAAYESFAWSPVTAYRTLKEKDARIIFVFFFLDKVQACGIVHADMVDRRYVWFAIRDSQRAFWDYSAAWDKSDMMPEPDSDLSCTEREMEMVAPFIMFVTFDSITREPDETMATGITQRELDTHLSQNEEGSGKYMLPLLQYDGMTTLCMILLEAERMVGSERLNNFTLDDSEMSQLFVGIAKRLSFRGATGMVSFDDNLDRVTIWSLQTVAENFNSELGFQEAMFFASDGRMMIPDNSSIRIWAVPKDKITELVRTVIPGRAPRVAAYCLSAIGIAFSLALIILNVMYRKKKVVRLSSPVLNSISAIGCIYSYLCCVVLTLQYDQNLIPPEFAENLCVVRLWLASCGFTLMFGSLFAKTFRVHLIFTNVSAVPVRISDKQLCGLILGLLAIDVVILTSWQTFDPLVTTIDALPSELIESLDAIRFNYMQVCGCQHLFWWAGGLLGFKLLQLLYGAFLAWEVRNVRIKELNDSVIIGVTIYIVAGVVSVGLFAALVFRDEPENAFISEVSTLIVSTSATLGLLSVPKLGMFSQTSAADSAFKVTNKITSSLNGSQNQSINMEQPDLVKENLFLKKTVEDLRKRLDP